MVHDETAELFNVGSGHADAAVRGRTTEGVFVVRAVNVVVGIAEEDLHDLHRIFGVPGCRGFLSFRPLRIGRTPGGIPDDVADGEHARGGGMLFRADRHVVGFHVLTVDTDDEDVFFRGAGQREDPGRCCGLMR